MHNFKPTLNTCIYIFYVNFNRLKPVSMELRNLCFQELIIMQTANQALCSLNRMSTDKNVLGKNCYHYIHFLHNHHASNGVSLIRVKNILAEGQLHCLNWREKHTCQVSERSLYSVKFCPPHSRL